MKQVVMDNAERWSGISMGTAYLVGFSFAWFGTYFERGSNAHVLLAVGFLAPVILAGYWFRRQARNAAMRAFELGESQGAVDAWTQVQDEIRRSK